MTDIRDALGFYRQYRPLRVQTEAYDTSYANNVCVSNEYNEISAISTEQHSTTDVIALRWKYIQIVTGVFKYVD